MAKLLGGSQIYGNATVNSYLVVSGNADLSGGNVTIGNANPVVSSILITAAGTGYTSNPTITVSSPTTLYGGTATANANLGVYGTPTISNGGTGYAVNNVLTMVGTANAVSNATFTVTSVSSGVITGVSVTTPGTYFSSNTTSPITVTGGTGTGATLTVAYGVNPPIVTYAGTGYVERPTVTITGGGGTGATAYATVGGPGNIFVLGNTLSISTPGGEAVRITDVVGANRYVSISPGQAGVSAPGIGTGGGGEAFDIFASSNSIRFSTGGAKVSSPQVLINHTSPVVNYLTLTGAATGGGPVVGVAGGDTNADLNLGGKGLGNVKTAGNLVVGGNLFLLGNLTTINYETVVYTETANILNVTGNLNASTYALLAGQTLISNSYASTSSLTGALVVTGGVGVGGNINIAGNITANTTGTTITAANIITTNGLYWANGTSFATSVVSGLATYSNSNVQAYLTSAATGVTANLGNIITTNGIYWANGSPYSSGAGNFFSSNIIANASTPSTSANTGAIIVPFGGMGVAGNIFVGGNIVGTYTNVTITSGAYTTTIDPYGNVTIANGLGNIIAGNVYAATIGNVGAKLVGDGSGITGVSGPGIAGPVQTANVALQSQINTSSSSGVFYPTFSNVQTGNSAVTTSSSLQYQPSSGNLTSTNFVGSLYGTVQTPIQGQIIQFGNLINLSVGNGTILQGNVVANSNAQANSAVTGAIVVPYGGIGVAGNVFIGSQLRAGTITSANANVNMYADGITGNIQVGASTSNVYITGNLVAGGNIYSNIIITNNGVYWPNGVSFATSVISGIAVYSNANVAAYLTQGVPGNININNGAGIYYTANGQPYGYGNTNVQQYLQSGSIANVRLGNAYILNNLTVANIVYTNQEIITLTDLVQGNVTANANTIPQFNSTVGAITLPYGGIYSYGNIITGQAIATTSGFYWAGNGQVYGYSNTAAASFLTSGATTVTANLGNIITANGVFYANGTSFTAGFTNYANANVAGYLPSYSGNISAANYYWSGNGASLYGNTDMAGYAYRFFMPNFTGNLQAGNILVSTTNGQSGNISAANVLSGGYFWSNGAPFITSNYGNANVAAYLPTYSGFLQAGRIQTFTNVAVGGNLTVAVDSNLSGNISINGLATQSNVNIISGISYQNTNLTFTALPFAPIANSQVVFSGSFGSFTSGTTYYVLTGASTTGMTVSTTPGGSAFNSGQPVLTAATGVTGTLTTIFTVPTPSYGTTSGALTVLGGTGIGGNLYVGGNLNIGANVTSGLSIVGATTHYGTTTAYGQVTFGDLSGNVTFNPNATRSLNLIGTNAVMRIARPTPPVGTGDPAVELLALDPNTGATTQWWDFFTNSDQFNIRRRTNGQANVVLRASQSSVWLFGNSINLGTDSSTVTQINGVTQVLGANTATSTTTGALQVTGGMSAQGNIYANAFYTVSGLYWAGNNNVINVGSTGGNPTGASGQMQYNQGGSLAAANLLYYSGNNTVVANSGVSSVNTTSGAFQVVGGAGITGNLWAGNVWSTSLYTNSGVFWSGNLQPIYLGNVLSANNLIFTNSTTNTLQVNGGANVGTILTVGNTITATGNIVAASGVSSTNTTTGALVVVGGAGISGNVNIGGNVTVGGNVLPSANVTYNLGSPTQRFASLYLSGNTIYIGSATISASAGSMTLTTDTGGSFSVTGSIAGQGTGSFGNLIANSGVASNGTSSGALQVGGGIGVTGNINSGGNISVTNFLTTGANITSQGNIIGSNFFFNNGAAITAGFVTSNFTGNMTLGNLNAGNIKSGVGIAGQGGTIYVSASTGNDSALNAGTFNNPFATIKAALAVAQAGQTVQVGPGVYTENNPITVPAYTSLLGNDLRTVFIQPQNPNSDLIWVNPGVFINGFTLRNYNASGFAYPSTGNIAATVSPYIQNITSKTTASTATAVTIDGNLCSSGFKAMIIGFFTIINQNGYGIVLKNSAYSQLVNIYTIGCEQGIVAQSGSFVTLNGSDTSIGNVALRADGYGPLLTYGNTQGYSSLGTFNITMNSNVSPKVNQVMIINGDTNYYSIDNVNYSGSGNVWTVNIQETYTANLAPNANVAFYQRSAIIASAHTFEYVGAGNFMANALPQFGGIPNPTYTVIQTNGGHITYTATDHKGNFMIGPNLTINQVTGVISGDSFNRSMFALMTPYILALEA